MHLIAQLTAISSPGDLRRYAVEVEPLMARHGGRIVAISSRSDVVEGEPVEGIHVIHEWESRSAFDAFWTSPDYQPLKALRRGACDTRIVVLGPMTTTR
jgi:uncharacterized protein (DUF1330 family)